MRERERRRSLCYFESLKIDLENNCNVTLGPLYAYLFIPLNTLKGMGFIWTIISAHLC